MRNAISIILAIFIVCSCDSTQKNNEEAENVAKTFLKLISEKNFIKAGKMIDSKSVDFKKRNELMKEIQFDSEKGNLIKFNTPHFSGVSNTTVKGLFYSKSSVSFNLELKYEKDEFIDYHSIHFVVINYGKGWLINQFEK